MIAVSTITQLAVGKAKFWMAVDNKSHQVLGAVMFPNLHHISANRKNKLFKKFRKEAMLLIGQHDKFIETGSICIEQNEKTNIGMITNRLIAHGESPLVFNFNQTGHRFIKPVEIDRDNASLHESLITRQSAYLNSQVVFKAWAAVDNGLVVGIVMFPNLDDDAKYRSKEFHHYKSKARTLLQKIGYVISGDMVFSESSGIKYYTYHHKHRQGYITVRDWVKEYGLSKALREIFNYQLQ